MKIPKKYDAIIQFGVLISLSPIALYLRDILLGTLTSTQIWIFLGWCVVCMIGTVISLITVHNYYGMEFDTSGVTAYGPFGIVRHTDWDNLQIRCIIVCQGKKEVFYFSNDPIPEEKRYWTGGRNGVFVGDVIFFDYTSARYQAFCESCPNIELEFIEFRKEKIQK